MLPAPDPSSPWVSIHVAPDLLGSADMAPACPRIRKSWSERLIDQRRLWRCLGVVIAAVLATFPTQQR
jgi:hypothetical protein